MSYAKKWLKNNPQDIVFGMERTTEQTHYRAGNGLHAVYLERRGLIDSWWKQKTFSINPLHLTLLKFEQKAFESPYLKFLFANSKMVQKEILERYEIPAAKIKVVHNGVEWHAWQSHFEATFPRKATPYHFLFIGNGYKRKGLLFLLEGLKLLKQKDYVLTVIGQERDPAYFMNQAKKMGLMSHIRFLGPQKDVIPFYQGADSLVLPSIYDPFANVTNEALAMGLHVITSEFNGGHEVLQAETGETIRDLKSAENMALCLERALDKPKTESQAEKRRSSIKYLDFSIQLDKIVDVTLKTHLSE